VTFPASAASTDFPVKSTFSELEVRLETRGSGRARESDNVWQKVASGVRWLIGKFCIISQNSTVGESDISRRSHERLDCRPQQMQRMRKIMTCIRGCIEASICDPTLDATSIQFFVSDRADDVSNLSRSDACSSYSPWKQQSNDHTYADTSVTFHNVR